MIDDAVRQAIREEIERFSVPVSNLTAEKVIESAMVVGLGNVAYTIKQLLDQKQDAVELSGVYRAYLNDSCFRAWYGVFHPGARVSKVRPKVFNRGFEVEEEPVTAEVAWLTPRKWQGRWTLRAELRDPRKSYHESMGSVEYPGFEGWSPTPDEEVEETP